MGRKSRTAVLKRQREVKKAEKAALKREKRGLREAAPAQPDQVATTEDLAGYGFDTDPTSADEEPEPPRAVAEEPLIAVFVDYENLAIGARNLHKGNFKIELVLRRLLEKGRIVFRRAYCDWGKYRSAVREFHTHGVEMVDIPHSKVSGKNSADIRMVVDALDLSYQKDHIDTFALLSGDSDFSPLVAKLKENDKRVVGCGVKSSTSDLLIRSCDEFIYYDDLARVSESAKAPRSGRSPAARKADDATSQLVQIVRSLERDYDTVWGSMVKQTIRRVFPGFNEEAEGYRSFAEFLEGAAKKGLIELEYDERRGNYEVRSRRS